MLRTLVFYFFEGAIYGILGVGLVLVYRTTRVFNVAQGEFGTVAAYLMFLFFEQLHWPYAISAVLAVLGVIALGLLTERLVIRPLRSGPRVTLLLATVAVALLLISIELVAAGAENRTLHPAVSGGPFSLFGADIFAQQLLILGVAALVGAGIIGVRRTRWGLAFVATSSDPTAAHAAGIKPDSVSRMVWGSAALVGALAGLIQSPTSGLTPAFLTALPGGALVPALAGAMLGGMESPLGALAGGILVGLVQGVGVHVLGAHLPGAQDLTVFILLVVVLVARPQRLLGLTARQVA
jgi:branched-chain amino acid transport system permease protein